MNKIKRVLSLILVMVMLVGMMPNFALFTNAATVTIKLDLDGGKYKGGSLSKSSFNTDASQGKTYAVIFEGYLDQFKSEYVKKEGYVFKGYKGYGLQLIYGDNSLWGTINTGLAAGTYTLTAEWESSKVDVSFNASPGTLTAYNQNGSALKSNVTSYTYEDMYLERAYSTRMNPIPAAKAPNDGLTFRYWKYGDFKLTKDNFKSEYPTETGTFRAYWNCTGSRQTTTTPATCTTAGKTVSACPYCSQYSGQKDYINNFHAKQETTIPATGHDWGDAFDVVDATCTAAKTYKHTCKTCGTTETVTEGSPIAHVMGEWIDIGNGNSERYCTLPYNCGYKESNKNTYDIKLNYNGGTAHANDATKVKTYTYGTAVTLYTPTKTGYTFAGWYTDAELTNPISTAVPGTIPATYVPAKDAKVINLYAKWTAIQYTVTFDVNGGNALTPNTMQHTYGTTTSGFPVPTRTGYDFQYWTKTKNDPNTRIDSIGPEDISAALTVFAYWSGKGYDIVYHIGDNLTDGMLVAGVDHPTKHTYGQTTTLFSTDTTHVVRTGYTFAGWYTDETLTTKVTSLATTTYTDTIHLYPKWTAKTNAVTYKYARYSEGVLKNAMETLSDSTEKTYFSNPAYATAVSRSYGSEMTLPTLTVPGYVWDGKWYTDAECTEPVNTTGKTIAATAYPNSEAITLYAKVTTKVTPIVYHIDTNAIDGMFVDGYTAPSKHVYNQGKITLPVAANVTRPGYTFAGWFEAEDLSGTKVTEYASTKDFDNDYVVHLYPKWTPNTLTIKFRGATASSDITAANMKLWFDIPVQYPTIDYPGVYKLPTSSNRYENDSTYILAGFYNSTTIKDDTRITEIDTADHVGSGNANVRIYAKWIEKSSHTNCAGDSYGDHIVEENRVESTCHTPGYYEIVTYCGVLDCGAEISRVRHTLELDPTNHEDMVHVDEQEPTCTEIGWDAYEYCTKCTYTTYVEKAKLGHSFTNYVSNEDATCLVDGTKTAVCDREGCNATDTQTDVDSKLGHSFTNYVSNNDATCTEDGTKTATCDREGCNATDTQTDVDSKLGHDYESVVTDPTCTSQGYTTHTCQRTGCGHSYVDSYVDYLGHSYVGAVTTKATCTETGVKTFTCSNCGDVYTEVIAVREGGHVMGEWFEVVAPDYTTKGTDKRVCTNVETETHAACDYPETCETPCTPDKELPTGKVTLVGLGKEYNGFAQNIWYEIFNKQQYQVSISASDDETGVGSIEYYVQELSEGDDMLTKDDLAALNKNAWESIDVDDPQDIFVGEKDGNYIVYVRITDKANTYNNTQPNNIEYICTNGLVVDSGDPVITGDKEGCTSVKLTISDTSPYTVYDEYNGITTELTVTGNTVTVTGEGVHNIKVKDKAENESDVYVVTIGHKPGNVKVENNVDPDCTNTGSYDNVIYCTVCDAELSRDTITVDALDHAWDEGEVTTEPTCSATGIRTHTCTRENCNETKTEIEPIVPTAHKAEAAVETSRVPATCTENGYYVMTVYCEYCDAVLDTETHTLGALDHAWDEGEVTTEPTCTKTGVKTFTCKNDTKHTYTEAVAALGHDEIAHEAKAPTCTEKGWNAYVTCSRCDYTTKTELNVDSVAHPSASVKVKVVETVPSTCAVNGYKIEVTYCADCNAELNREKIDLPISPDHGVTETVRTVVTVMGIDVNGANIPGEYVDTVKCSVCGHEYSETTVYEYPVAQNVNTDKIYSDLKLAINEAAKGNTIKLLVDFTAAVVSTTAEEEAINFLVETYACDRLSIVNNELILDLNGHDFKTDGVDLGVNCHVVDSYGLGKVDATNVNEKAAAAGRFIVPEEKVAGDGTVLNGDNSMLPMMVASDGTYNSYVFVQRTGMNQFGFEESYKFENGVEFIFRPTLGTTVLNQYFFGDGCSDEDIAIGMRIFIDGVKAGDILYDSDPTRGDYIVSIVYNEGRAFEISINGHVYTGVGTVTVQSVMISDTGVERTGTKIIVPSGEVYVEPEVNTDESNA